MLNIIGEAMRIAAHAGRLTDREETPRRLPARKAAEPKRAPETRVRPTKIAS